MASKKSNKAKAMMAQLPPLSGRTSSSTSSLQGNSSVHITTFVNEGESIDELFQPGRSERIYERARPMHRGPLPPSFHSPLSIRQRGSSAGHSPQGSSDDGFSTSRNTLSPSSFNDPLTLQTAPCLPPAHKKQASAPELNHRGLESYPPASRSMAAFAPAPQPQSISAQHGYSKSVSAIDQQAVPFPPVAHHIKSTSYDANHLAAPFHGFHGQQAHSQQDLYQTAPMHQQKEKSQSLDHITIAHNQSQMNNYDSLPPNWSYAFTAEGDVYFIDHENQKTTWFDPRLPRHEQEEAIMARHSTQPLDVRMQQLQMERSGMHERQLELARMGLIQTDRMAYMQSPTTPQQQQQQFQQHVNNNVNPQQMQQQQYYTQTPMMRQQPAPLNHTRRISDDSMMDFSYASPEAYTRDIPNFESEELNMYLGGMQM